MNGGGGAASYSGGGSSGSETFAAADDPAKKAGKGTDSKKGSELAPLPELPGDPAKEFAALDKLFDAVAGKMKTDIAKGVDGALLSEAGAHTSKSGPVDPVALVSEVKEQAKEEQEMEKPLPEEKEVVRKVASLPPPAVPQEHGTFQSKHYLDTVDFDMSLFQRVKESLTKKVRDGQFNPGERHSSI